MAAAPLPEITYAEFAARLGVRERRIPVEGIVETSYRCNLRCAHCYVNEPAGARQIEAAELPLERLLLLIDEVAEAGCLFLVLTGGEVLVRADFPELYRHAVGRGLLVTVFTNGTLVTDKIADLLARHPPEAVEISLYGMTQETYERVTQVPGSYDKCIAGIEKLLARGVRVRLKTMALSWNLHEVEAMEAYARRLGLPFRFDSHLNPRVDCGANRNGELQLRAEQAVRLDLASPERLAELRAFCEKHARPDPEWRGNEQVYTCGAGQSTFTVDPYGRLQMCQLSRRSHLDLRRSSFASGWNEAFPRLRERKWRTNSVCRRCNLLSLCGSCPGAAEMETGDVESLVPEFCALAHRRAFAAMGEACGHREDATCCLGDGRDPAPEAPGGCGSCGVAAPPPALLQIRARRPPAA